MIVLNPEGFKELSKHSGNPFLDAMTDLQGFFQTIGAYQQNKEFIDKYSDRSLSDLKDKVKNILPDALNEKGELNFSKLEELAGQGNELASSVLNIKKHREAFANAPLVDKINALKNPELADTLSANILDKQVVIKKKKQLIEDTIKKSNIPDKYKPLFLAFSEKIAKDPQTLSVMIPLLASSLGSLNNDTDNNK
jgi:hypothetical protein